MFKPSGKMVGVHFLMLSTKAIIIFLFLKKASKCSDITRVNIGFNSL